MKCWHWGREGSCGFQCKLCNYCECSEGIKCPQFCSSHLQKGLSEDDPISQGCCEHAYKVLRQRSTVSCQKLCQCMSYHEAVVFVIIMVDMQKDRTYLSVQRTSLGVFWVGSPRDGDIPAWPKASSREGNRRSQERWCPGCGERADANLKHRGFFWGTGWWC